MFRTTRTIYNIALETAKMLGISYTPPIGTTLNEKFGVLNKQSTVNPDLRYYTLGMSYDSLIDPNGSVSLDSIKHYAYDASVHIPLPFLLVLKDVGLTPMEESTYRIKTEVEINGIKYIACYLKIIDNINTNSYIYDIKHNSENGYTIEEFIPVNHNVLSPTLSAGSTLYPDDIDYLGISQKLTINLSVEEIVNIKAAADIMYPFKDEVERHTIGEIAFCTGIETGDNEISDTQIAFFLKSKKLLDNITLSSTDAVSETLEIGGMQSGITRRKVN